MEHPPVNYVDLGNGLGLNTYNRGPPSIISDSTDEFYDENDSSYYNNNTERNGANSVNTYMAQLINSPSTTSNDTSFFHHTIAMQERPLIGRVTSLVSTANTLPPIKTNSILRSFEVL